MTSQKKTEINDLFDSIMAEEYLRRFFGIAKGMLNPEGRFSYYVKKLSPGSVGLVCSEVETALDGLERYLSEHPECVLETARLALIMRLASAGIKGIGALA